MLIYAHGRCLSPPPRAALFSSSSSLPSPSARRPQARLAHAPKYASSRAAGYIPQNAALAPACHHRVLRCTARRCSMVVETGRLQARCRYGSVVVCRYVNEDSRRHANSDNGCRRHDMAVEEDKPSRHSVNHGLIPAKCFTGTTCQQQRVTSVRPLSTVFLLHARGCRRRGDNAQQ